MSKIIFTPNISKPGGLGGISVGTTPVASGTVGCIFFEGAGNVVQQDAGLFWDNTNKRLGVGATPASNVRLDVRAQGALSSDIGLRVRNSSNTADLIRINGDRSFNINNVVFFNGTNWQIFSSDGSGNPIIETAIGFAGLYFWSAWEQHFKTGNNFQFLISGETKFKIDANNVTIKNGSAPSSETDCFKMFSADIVAGNAAPHFRTEAGDVIKLYKETTAVAAATLVHNVGTIITDTDTFDGYTIQQIVKALRNQGLLA